MRPAAGLLIMTLAVAACGGASASASPVAPAQVSGPAPSDAATDAAAPSDTTAPTAASAGTAACALITEAEATTFLGLDPGPGNETGTADSPACAYGGSLTLQLVTADAKSLYDSTKAAMQGSGKAQALDGVGDEGYAFIVADTIAQMEVLKGSKLLTVNIQGDPSKQNVTLPRLTDLAKMAVDRL